MPTPTECGWYLWTDSTPGAEAECVKVYRSCRDPHKGVLRCVVLDVLPLHIDVSAMVGEWGERIPDNETLKAMRELAAEAILSDETAALRRRWQVQQEMAQARAQEASFQRALADPGEVLVGLLFDADGSVLEAASAAGGPDSPTTNGDPAGEAGGAR